MASTVLPLIMTLNRGATAQLVIKLRERVDENTIQGYDLSGFTTVTVTGDTLEDPADPSVTQLFQKAITVSGLTDATTGDLEMIFVAGDWTSSPLDTLGGGCYFLDVWGTDGGGLNAHIIKGVFDYVSDIGQL